MSCATVNGLALLVQGLEAGKIMINHQAALIYIPPSPFLRIVPFLFVAIALLNTNNESVIISD